MTNATGPAPVDPPGFPDDDEAVGLHATLKALLDAHDPTTTAPEAFLGAQFDAGLAWVHFPEGRGGRGARPELQAPVDRALAAAGAPARNAMWFFIHLAGPTILTHGSPEQCDRFLRRMFTGEDLWCQLFSEPGAGSDLAGLACRAERDGDEWVVNGQKVWNTMAHLADWGLLVTRSDPDAPKHKGMTYFALDMRSPGVEVRPLRQITGGAEFNEVYLTDVRIPDANRIGAAGEGWRAALTTLGNERSSIGAVQASEPERGSGPIARLVALWDAAPEHVRTASMRDRVADLWVRAEVLRLTNLRAAEARRAGNPGAEGSISKMAFSELSQRITDTAIDLLGPAGQVGFDYSFSRPGLDFGGPHDGDPGYELLRARASTIEGGSSQIMRNILGEQVLGLPGEPRVDKDVAWKDVPRN
jgi:alkylation response protein AidB-like acyl-CoA dehydrogenase